MKIHWLRTPRRWTHGLASPGRMTRVELAEAAALTPGSGTFSNYLGILRRNGLILVEGQDVSANADLFTVPRALNQMPGGH